jgi:hypothetical protein
MPLRFNFSTRDWIWFCIVVALILGWGSHVRYSWWLEDHVVNHPTTIHVSDQRLTEQLNDTIEQLMECKEKYAAVENAATSIMNADQKKEFAKLIGGRR